MKILGDILTKNSGQISVGVEGTDNILNVRISLIASSNLMQFTLDELAVVGNIGLCLTLDPDDKLNDEIFTSDNPTWKPKE